MSEKNLNENQNEDLKPVRHNLRVEFTNGQTEFYYDVLFPTSDRILECALFDEKNKFLQFIATNMLDTRTVNRIAINKSVIAKAELIEAI